MECFYNQLQSTIAKVSASEILIPVGDWNGHIRVSVTLTLGMASAHIIEGKRVLKFETRNGLHVGNT